MTQWGVDTLFNPAKRHMDEEKRRLQSTREEVGDNSGGKRIDLTTGKVRIQRTDGAAQATEGADPEGIAAVTGDDAATKSGAATESTDSTGAASTAAERARRRRAAVRRAGPGPAGGSGT